MRLIKIDFAAPARRSSKNSVAILVIGALLAGAAVFDDSTQSDEILALQTQQKHAKNALQRTRLETSGGNGIALAGFKQSDIVVHRLATPWGGLLGALEQAQNESIALLGVEPDSHRGSLRLSGEAKDLPALVAYMKSIEGKGGISAVRLLTQQVKPDDAQHPVVFVVEARWTALPADAAKAEL